MRDVENPKLGRLVWVADDMLEGRIVSGTKDVELSLEVVDEAALASQLEHGERLVTGIVELERRANQFLVEKMLRLKNEGWLREGEQPLSEDEFRKRITLGRLDIGDGGSATLIFDDDDVFWGHYLTADLRPDGALDNAGMFG